jgi:hypothetical protein
MDAPNSASTDEQKMTVSCEKQKDASRTLDFPTCVSTVLPDDIVGRSSACDSDVVFSVDANPSQPVCIDNGEVIDCDMPITRAIDIVYEVVEDDAAPCAF